MSRALRAVVLIDCCIVLYPFWLKTLQCWRLFKLARPRFGLFPPFSVTVCFLSHLGCCMPGLFAGSRLAYSSLHALNISLHPLCRVSAKTTRIHSCLCGHCNLMLTSARSAKWVSNRYMYPYVSICMHIVVILTKIG